MIIKKAYRTELDPNNVQRTLLLKHAGSARYAYNWGLDRINKKLSKPNAMQLHREINQWKKDNPWAYDVSKCCFQEALRDLQRAFQNFFKDPKKFRHPTFKKKNQGVGSFRLTGTICVEESKVKLPRIGSIRLKENGYLPPSSKPLSATVSEHAGRWYVSVLVQEEVQPQQATNRILGVDLGVNKMAVCSDGTIYENPKSLSKLEGKIKRVQRQISRRVKGSNRRAKAKKKLGKIWDKVASVRRDTIHKATSEIVKTKRPMVIVLEDLNVAGMTKNHCLAKSILDAGMREFRRQVEYKALWNGVELVFADRFYPSSKTCSKCGKVNPSLKLSDRTYKCSCGNIMDRDLNAAVNLERFSTVSSTGINARGEEKLQTASAVGALQ